MAKTFQESMDELNKAFGTDEELDTDAIEELNTRGLQKLRKSVDIDDDDDDDGEADDFRVAKSLDDSTETEYLDESEVYGRIAKSADGDLAMLINGNEAIEDMVKSFSGAVGQSNRKVAEATVLIKSIQHNQTLQNSAIVALSQKLDAIIETLDGQPVRKANSGAFTGLVDNGKARRGSDSAIEKSIGEASIPVDNRFGGCRPDELSSIVKSYFNDRETRTQFGLTADHLLVQKSGLTRLPKSLVRHMAEKGEIDIDIN